MDRRSLLKSTALLSVAAVVPAAVAVAVAETAAPVAAAVTSVVVPVKATPYKDHVWEWFVSHDQEVYYEGFATKEEAVEYAKRCEYSIVTECLQQDFRLDIDGWQLIEMLNESNEDLIGEGDGIEATTPQVRDLEAMVERAIEVWAIKHKIKLTAWTFADTRNDIEIQLPS